MELGINVFRNCLCSYHPLGSQTDVDSIFRPSLPCSWILARYTQMLSKRLEILFFFFIFLFFQFYFIFKIYIILLVLPNIKMNPPQVYMCSPSRTLLPPPAPYHPAGPAQCTSPKHRAGDSYWSTEVVHEKWKWSHSVVSDSSRPHGLQPTRLFPPWDSPGKNTGMGCHFLLQGIFSTQGSNLGLPHFRQTL